MDLQAEERVFDAAIKIDGDADRRAYLDLACADDPDLRASVEELIAAHDSADGFLEAPLMEPRREDLSGLGVGRYRLLRCIGEGGFGIVYSAEQQEPVRRDVALKILRVGLDAQDVVRRFEAERQVLAMMRHPNIATVLDAGTVTLPDDWARGSWVEGHPYFVMELVDGQPIDEYCDRERLTVSERLHLFCEVCRAVQHAHQKGVVHRDLKPSNLLITLDGARPVLKVIDFGISKSLQSASTSPREHRPTEQADLRHPSAVSTDDTNAGEQPTTTFAGTPAYMSPEQILRKDDIDVRADIYALGGVLYKLLTGHTPFAAAERGDDWVRRIQEYNPVMPSQCFSSPGASLANVAADRRLSDARLVALLRGDLDQIVMKAIQKDRDFRYDTVTDFARDIELYLRDEPVSAVSPSWNYLVGKFVKRHWSGVFACSVLFIALIFGATLAVVGFFRAQQEKEFAREQWQRAEVAREAAFKDRIRAERNENLAVAQTKKAQHVISLLERIVALTNPDGGNSPDYTVHELLDDFAETLESSPVGDPEVEAAVRRTLGRSYWRLGDFMGSMPHLERAWRLREETLGANHAQTIQSEVDYALVLLKLARLTEAERAANHAIAHLGQHGPDEEYAWALYSRAAILYQRRRFEEASKAAAEALRVLKRVEGVSEHTVMAFELPVGHGLIAQGKLIEAEQHAQRVLARLDDMGVEKHANRATANRILATAQSRLGRHDEAEKSIRIAIDLDRSLSGHTSALVVQDLLVMSQVLGQSGQSKEADQAIHEAAAIVRQAGIVGKQRTLTLRALAKIAQRNDPVTADSAWAEAIESLRTTRGPTLQLVRFCWNRALVNRLMGRTSDAHRLYQEAIKACHSAASNEQELRAAEASGQSREVHLATSLQLATETAWELDLDAEAEQYFLELSKVAATTQRHRVKVFEQLARGQVLVMRGEHEEAQRLLHTMIELPARRPIAYIKISAAIALADSLAQTNQFEQAERVLMKLHRSVRDTNHPRIVAALFDLYQRWNKPEKAEQWRRPSPYSL